MKAILVLMLLSMFTAQGFAANMLKAAECPETENVVTFKDVREVYASMTSSITTADLTKGEFETTDQHEARKARAMVAANFPKVADNVCGLAQPIFISFLLSYSLPEVESHAVNNLTG